VGCKYHQGCYFVRTNNMRQPELHYLDGLWYIYYTAGSSANLDLQRPHVLKGKSEKGIESERSRTDDIQVAAIPSKLTPTSPP
jgi:GH43 family beta-xylosidase